MTITFISDATTLSCSGATVFYLENTHAAYASMLSTLLTARVTGVDVHVWINDSAIQASSKQLAIVAF